MSYLPQRRARPGQQGGHLRRPRTALGSIFGADFTPSDQCDAAGKTEQAPYDQQMAATAAQWKSRDDFYYPDDMSKILTAGANLISSAQDVLDKISVNYGIQNTAQQDIKKVNADSLNFIVALSIAKAKGATVIDAPGLRDWIIDVIGAAGEAAYRTAYLQCSLSFASTTILPAIESAFGMLGSLASAFYSVLKAVVNVAVKVGEVVYKTTVGTLDFVATMVQYAPLIGGAFLAAYLWKKYKRGK